jgi:hypothetical protein
MSKVGGRKESIRLINDNLKQYSRRGEIIAQCYGMIKIPHAGSGYSGLNSREEVDIRLEQRTNE